jgi:hypothetical protein
MPPIRLWAPACGYAGLLADVDLLDRLSDGGTEAGWSFSRRLKAREALHARSWR